VFNTFLWFKGADMKPLLVLEIPGLTGEMVKAHAPRLNALAEAGGMSGIDPVLPAVTMPAHASILTGLPPGDHGVVANGWFHRAHNEVMFWRQSEKLVQGEAVWDAGKKRDASFTCFKHFWWPGMASTADLYVNVRPVYFADGRKAPDVYANRPGLSVELQEQFGTFPLFNFWGPLTSIKSTRWIADTAMHVMGQELSTLNLVYLPHLDYKQQSHGPGHPSIAAEVAELDGVAGELIDFAAKHDMRVMVISSYHMNAVDTPVHLNRLFREQGWLKVIENAAGELIDYGTSKVFAVADHQSAQIYVQDPGMIEAVKTVLLQTPGVARVFDRADQDLYDVAAEGSGELFVLAEKKAWFTYYYWLDDAKAPDFARTIAIHAKPGYDPCELFLDPTIGNPKLRVAKSLLKKKLGFRYLLDVIPLDASLVKGSHGLRPDGPGEFPVYIDPIGGLSDERIPMTALKQRMLDLIFA
jgi:predicted AlkP superfamily pyrophosphatase or phosphodiesterase